MHSDTTTFDAAGASVPPLDRYASYEDDAGHLICDRKNPQAWIRSDVTVDVEN